MTETQAAFWDGVPGMDSVQRLLSVRPDAAPVIRMLDDSFRRYAAGVPHRRKLCSVNALVAADAALDQLRSMGVHADEVAEVTLAILSLASSRRSAAIVQKIRLTATTVYKANARIQKIYGADAEARIHFRQLRNPRRAPSEGEPGGVAEFHAWVSKYGSDPGCWTAEPVCEDRTSEPQPQGAAPPNEKDAVPGGMVEHSPLLTPAPPPRSVQPSLLPAEECTKDTAPAPEHVAPSLETAPATGAVLPGNGGEPGRDIESIRKAGASRFKRVGIGA